MLIHRLENALLASIVAGCLALPAAAGDSVPFKASGLIQSLGSAPGGGCPIVQTTLINSGVATYIGKFTGTQSHCFDPNTFLFSGGNATFTGANGDELVVTYSGGLVPTDTPGIVAYAASTFTIVGGSGRFEGASGGGVITGTFDLLTGLAPTALDGTISSVGSLH